MKRATQKGAASNRPRAGSPAQMLNLGPASTKMLANVGIYHTEQIRTLGALETYWRVKAITPNASLNLLWALAGAIENVHWTKISRTTRSTLLRELDARADMAKRQGNHDEN